MSDSSQIKINSLYTVAANYKRKWR